MAPETGHIGLLTLELWIPQSGSLKSKRKVILSLKDRLRHQFNISIAEIAENDKWQKAVLGICMIANDRKYVEGCFQKMINFIEDSGEARLIGQSVEFL